MSLLFVLNIYLAFSSDQTAPPKVTLSKAVQKFSELTGKSVILSADARGNIYWHAQGNILQIQKSFIESLKKEGFSVSESGGFLKITPFSSPSRLPFNN